MITDADRLHAEYITLRDTVLQQTHSPNLTDHLDAIRPLWLAYRDRLKSPDTFRHAA